MLTRLCQHAFSYSWLGISLLLMAFGAQVQAADPAGEGNRRNEPRLYAAEISPARAFLETATHKRRAVLIDVRSVPEYLAGHPQVAYSIPYPFAYQECDTVEQLPQECKEDPSLHGRYEDGACKCRDAVKTQAYKMGKDGFLDAVAAVVRKKGTPIYLLCRSSKRSIDAANLLAEGGGYTDARNIYEGFVGKFKTDDFGNSPLDLTGDGLITAQDKDGWRYYQGLPFTTRLHWRLIYHPSAFLYYEDYGMDADDDESEADDAVVAS